jgi:hypothetical protein
VTLEASVPVIVTKLLTPEDPATLALMRIEGGKGWWMSEVELELRSCEVLLLF